MYMVSSYGQTEASFDDEDLERLVQISYNSIQVRECTGIYSYRVMITINSKTVKLIPHKSMVIISSFYPYHSKHKVVLQKLPWHAL